MTSDTTWHEEFERMRQVDCWMLCGLQVVQHPIPITTGDLMTSYLQEATRLQCDWFICVNKFEIWWKREFVWGWLLRTKVHQLYCTCGGFGGKSCVSWEFTSDLHQPTKEGEIDARGPSFNFWSKRPKHHSVTPLNKTISVVKYLWRILVR